METTSFEIEEASIDPPSPHGTSDSISCNRGIPRSMNPSATSFGLQNALSRPRKPVKHLARRTFHSTLGRTSPPTPSRSTPSRR